jgi:hypothetical protein
MCYKSGTLPFMFRDNEPIRRPSLQTRLSGDPALQKPPTNLKLERRLADMSRFFEMTRIRPLGAKQ